MVLLGENHDDSTPALPNVLDNFLLNCSTGWKCGREELPLACRVLLNLRRRTRQTPRVELSVRVCIPRRAAQSAPSPPRALASASCAAAPRSAFPGVFSALGRS